MRLLAIACFAMLIGACADPPINVESAKAVIVQNETTKKHIQGFTDANKRTQEHVKKIEEKALEQKTSLETAQKYLEELLNE